MNAPLTPEERGHLAAEYALGVLDGEDLRGAAALAAADAEFGDDVARWLGRLGPLLDDVAPVEPPARLFAAIEQRIGQADRPAGNVVQLRRRVNVWRGVSAGASAIAASLALVLLTQPRPVTQPPPPPAATPAETAPLVATMEAEGSDARLVATWDADGRSLVVAAAAGVEPDSDRSLELWVIPADGTPRSLGLLPQDAPLHRSVEGPVAAYLAEGATLAVSVEPVGGSPTQAPTGAVIAAGPLRRT